MQTKRAAAFLSQLKTDFLPSLPFSLLIMSCRPKFKVLLDLTYSLVLAYSRYKGTYTENSLQEGRKWWWRENDDCDDLGRRMQTGREWIGEGFSISVPHPLSPLVQQTLYIPLFSGNLHDNTIHGIELLICYEISFTSPADDNLLLFITRSFNVYCSNMKWN